MFKKGNTPWNKGKHTGIKPWLGKKRTGQNIGKWMKGKKLSEETKEKLRIAQTGRKYTLESRKKMSNSARKGEKSNFWRGGNCSLKIKIKSSFEYRQWRSCVFTKDSFTCQECGIRGGKLVAHHIESFAKIFHRNNIQTLKEAMACEELWNVNNGQTLCEGCHSLTDNYGWKEGGQYAGFLFGAV